MLEGFSPLTHAHFAFDSLGDLSIPGLLYFMFLSLPSLSSPSRAWQHLRTRTIRPSCPRHLGSAHFPHVYGVFDRPGT